MTRYEQLKQRVEQLRAAGKLDERPSDAQRADWAYGNVRLSNHAVTREMAEAAVRSLNREAR